MGRPHRGRDPGPDRLDPSQGWSPRSPSLSASPHRPRASAAFVSPPSLSPTAPSTCLPPPSFDSLPLPCRLRLRRRLSFPPQQSPFHRDLRVVTASLPACSLPLPLLLVDERRGRVGMRRCGGSVVAGRGGRMAARATSGGSSGSESESAVRRVRASRRGGERRVGGRCCLRGAGAWVVCLESCAEGMMRLALRPFIFGWCNAGLRFLSKKKKKKKKKKVLSLIPLL